jgi:putative transposase
MIKPVFANNELYHVYNRGVEKRDLFMDEADYSRFVHNLYDFNDHSPVVNVKYYFDQQSRTVQSRVLKGRREPRKLLVDILVFTLMPNHFHLLLRQTRENGISRFMQKLGTGYSMYFNKKYERVGALFQGKFKASHINEEIYFIHLPHYIHTNPLELSFRGRTPITFLSDYRWSSFPDYIGRKNFPSVTNRRTLLDLFGGEKGYYQHTAERLNNTDNESLSIVKDVALE